MGKYIVRETFYSSVEIEAGSAKEAKEQYLNMTLRQIRPDPENDIEVDPL